VAAILAPVRDSVGAANVAIVLAIVTVVAAAFAGRWAGACTAVSAAISYNFFHTRPYLSLRVSNREDLITVGLLVLSASWSASCPRCDADRESKW
jgi:K+-sensing histidine kinase KdpD